MNTSEAVKCINKARLFAKGGWWGIKLTVNGNALAAEGFDTWIQRLESNGLRDDGATDCSVAEFKRTLEDFIHSARAELN